MSTLDLAHLLLGEEGEQPAGLVPALLDAAGARWPRHFPVGRRARTELDLARQLREALRHDFASVILESWRRHPEVCRSAAASRRHPVDPIFVSLPRRRFTWSTKPVIEVMAGDVRVARLELEVGAEVGVEGVGLMLRAGRLAEVRYGTWVATGSLSCNDRLLVKRSLEHQPLASAVPVGDGIELGMSSDAVRTLIVVPGPPSGCSRIVVEDGLVIGGHLSCGLVLWDDRAVAPHHAAVHRFGDSLILQDLGTTSGTQLNGERLRAPALLRRGDAITIGRRVLEVV